MKALHGFGILLGTILSIFGQVAPTEGNLRAGVSSGGILTFSSDGTIALSAPVNVSADVTIDANGHAVAINGQNLTTLFVLNGGSKLTLNGLLLANGRVTGANGTSVSVPGASVSGGAIQNNGGDLTAVDCVFSNNVALGGTGFTDPFATFSTSAGGDGKGGAIGQSAGSATIYGGSFLTNAALGGGNSGSAFGGAIYIAAGSLSISNVTFTANRARSGVAAVFKPASAQGGAISIESGSADIRLATFKANVAACSYNGSGYGGAVSARGSSVALVESTVSENRSEGGMPLLYHGVGDGTGLPALGGGVYAGANSTIWIESSLMVGNVVQGGPKYGDAGWYSNGQGLGGGIAVEGTTSVVNSTLANNTATPFFNLSLNSRGGAIHNAGTLSITNASIVGNTSDDPAVYAASGTLTVVNTLFGKNGGTTASSGITDAGHNLSATTTPALASASSQNNVNLKLGPLGLYGGPTATIPLMAGSPAINAGDDSAAPATDQRGRVRPFGSHSDVGAFESSPPFRLFGSVRGQHDATTTATLNGNSATADTAGAFGLDSPQGSASVSFSGTGQLFSPNPLVVDVQADMEIVGRGFELDKLAFHPEQAAFAYAGGAGETWRFDISTDFTNWTPTYTHAFGTAEVYLMPATNIETRAFVRGVKQ